MVIEDNLQSDATSAKVWCKQNKMLMNFDKTTYMVLGIQYKLQDAQFLNLKINNHDVEHVSKHIPSMESRPQNPEIRK